MAYQLQLKFGYEATDFTRIYEFDVDDSVAPADIVTAIQAVNASLSGGTADGLDTFFLSDDHDASKGNFNRIISAKTVANASNVIYPAGGN